MKKYGIKLIFDDGSVIVEIVETTSVISAVSSVVDKHGRGFKILELIRY